MNPGVLGIRDSVGAALRFTREHARQIAMLALVGAASMAGVALLVSVAPALGLLLNPVSTLISASVYALFLSAVLGAGGAERLVPNTGRVWASMAVVGFFMAIVCLVLIIPVGIILGAALSGFASDFEAAGQNQAAALALMTRIAQEQPAPLLLAALFYAVVWMALTARLYLAAPASVDRRRILTFETWSWTRGNMLRIVAARLMLLTPAYVLVNALTLLVGRVLGVDVFSPDGVVVFAQGSPLGYAALTFATHLLTFGLYSSLEAGLSTQIYRALAPKHAEPAN